MAVQNFGTGGGGFQLSPGVNVSEIDLTTITPAVATTVGAIAGVFRWGPVGQRKLVTSEADLVAQFGKPTEINPETFFTAANFLSYSNALYVARAAQTNSQFAAVAGGTANTTSTILNEDDYAGKIANIKASNTNYLARWPGDIGNSLKVSVCDHPDQYSYVIDIQGGTAANGKFSNNATAFSLSVGSTVANVVLNGANASFAGITAITEATAVKALFSTGNYLTVNVGSKAQSLKIINTGDITLQTNAAGGNTGVAWFNVKLDQPLKMSSDIITKKDLVRYWEYSTQVNSAPGRSVYVETYGNTASQITNPTTAQLDELHVVVVDEDGRFSGTPGTVLEVYQNVSRATDAKLEDGSSNYYRTVIDNNSKYIWVGADRTNAKSNTALGIASSTETAPLSTSFTGGVDVSEVDAKFADLALAYDLFVSSADVDVGLVIAGKSRKDDGANGTQLVNYLIDNIGEVRKDCVIFASPTLESVVNKGPDAAASVVAFRNATRSSSYAVLDSGYKYQYDKYNDVYRWIPLNGDIAGTCVRTDETRDPWYSPAGSTRGQIKNVIKLAFNPSKGERDLIYKNSINPVVTFPGQGTILYGDKTLLAKPSAFDRINVRRLFIVLEKTISQAAQSLLFEFNDEFTRTQFRNLVEPFLRDVQGRRGIYDFKVVCNETNNTSQIIDSNRFVGDIYIKPARSINYIQLNFVAVRTGVEFTEIAG
jgi:phage tail sheath protein FI